MAEELNKRIQTLEETLAGHESTVDDLSDMVREQWDIIDRLKREIERLTDRMERVEDTPGGDNIPTGMEKPPHY